MTSPPGWGRGVVVDRSGGRPWMTAAGDSIIPLDEWDLTIVVDERPANVPDPVNVLEIGDFTAESIRSAIRQLAAAGPIDRVSTTSEHFLEVVAAAREEHGIEGNGVQYTARLRDKWLMKQTAVDHRIRTVAGTRGDQLEPFLSQVPSPEGYVLKPRDESGAVGVHMVPDAAALQRVVGDLAHPSDYIVEARSPHPLVHVDVLVCDGHPSYQVSQYERPCHVSGGSVPLSSYTVDDPALLADVDSALHQIVHAWHVDNDVLHIEFFADPAGVVLLELAGRPGAAGVSQVFADTRGLDLLHAKTRLDFGIDPTPFATTPAARHGGWTVIYAPTTAPAVVDDHALHGHATRAVLDVTARRVNGVAGVGIATYTFRGGTVTAVRELIHTYESQVQVRPLKHPEIGPTS